MELVERLRAEAEANLDLAWATKLKETVGANCISRAAMLSEAADLLEEALKALKGLEPHLDAIVCFASDMGEHEPNRIAANTRSVLVRAAQGKSQ